MKLFMISNSKKFKGSVHVVYDPEGKLTKIDFSNTDLNASDIEKILRSISGYEEKVSVNFQSVDTVIVEGDFEVSFDDFMREYPYKRNTHLAREYWPKMKSSEQVQAFIASSEYRKYCDRESNWYKPMIADTWLKKKQYLNNWKQL
jgi:hypothetical protein